MFEISKQSILTLITVWICFCANYHVNAESCQGATVKNGTNQTIVDANNDTWTIQSDDKIYVNNELAGISSEVTLLVYWNQVIYQQNRYGGWWRWVNKDPPWEDTRDPRPSSHTDTASGCTFEPHTGITTTMQQIPTTNQMLVSTNSIPTLTSTTLVYDDPTTEKTTAKITDTSTDSRESIITAITTDKTTMLSIGKPPSPYFVPTTCDDPNYIGDSCDTSAQPCDLLKPCRNSGNCTNDPSRLHGYSCMCRPGYNGTNCEVDIRLCKSNTCLHKGICKELSNTTFHCNCTQGRAGVHCELLIDYCNNVACLNKGVCQSLVLDYKCECLFGTSGCHCEDVATSLLIRQYISKGFAYIAIIVLASTAAFIIILDILKYVFGIDPVRGERDRIRRKRALLETKQFEKLKFRKTYHL